MPTDDLIDFPVSDIWLDYYHRIGLTPRRSEGYFLRATPPQHVAQQPATESSGESAAVDRLWKAIRELREEIRKPAPRPAKNIGIDLPQ